MTGVLFGVVVAPASAAPHNDDLEDARPLRVDTAVTGTINGATRQRGEPRHGRPLAASSVWYRLRTKRAVEVSLTTCGARFDSVLAAYRGRSLRSLRLVKANDDGCGPVSPRASRIAFIARRGKTYWIRSRGPSGQRSVSTQGGACCRAAK